MEHGDTWRLWGPHKLEIWCHMASSSCNFEFMGSLGYWMSYKANTLGHMYHRSKFGGNITYMGEEESFWSKRDTWTRFPISMTSIMKML